VRALTEDIADHDSRLRMRGLEIAIAIELSLGDAVVDVAAADLAELAAHLLAARVAVGRPPEGPAMLTLLTPAAGAVLPGLLRYLNRHPALSYAFADRPGSMGWAPRPDEGSRERFDALRHAIDAGDDAVAHAAGELETEGDELRFRALRSEADPERQLAAAALFRSLVAALTVAPYRKPLVWFGPDLHTRHLLPSYLGRDLGAVLRDLTSLGFGLGPELSSRITALSAPIVETSLGDVSFSVRAAAEPGAALDPGLRRWEVRVDGEPAGDVRVGGGDLALYRVDPRCHVAAIRHRTLPLVLEWHQGSRAREIVLGPVRAEQREIPYRPLSTRRAECLTVVDLRYVPAPVR
jgi:Putative amidoligase enzyme (DUF2126)